MSTAQQVLLQRVDGTLVSAWNIVLQQDNHWWSAHVNADTGAIEAINDWVSHATEKYNVYPRTLNTPDDGPRSIVTNPADTTASPKGWVTDNTTTGNNVWAQNNPSGGSTWKNNHRPSANNNGFNFSLDLTKAPAKYVDAAITQLFYTVNTMHDLAYLYGFTEAAGNFQDINYSGQGVGGDYVIAYAQDGSGTNNANFATPPDGQHGVMRMYVWTGTTPNRDGDLEQDIVAHEFTHGISNRLTGGPSNADCLNDGEAGGMGEGWSDTVANLLRIKSGDTRSRNIEMGVYAYGSNIRNYPYSTSLTTNPETYGYLNRPDYQEVHAIGEVWATILYEVLWNLIDDNGIAGDLFSHDLSKGNSIMLQILLDGMKLQPCNPSFIDARDAIIQAEKNLTGGKNSCAIWRGFAKRGLGVNASSDGYSHTEDTSVPSGC
ncbi:peptidase M36 [Coemansia spiralis]|nr:peptidase M36 [Coemansia spiralis]